MFIYAKVVGLLIFALLILAPLSYLIWGAVADQLKPKDEEKKK
jgi:hypothetical protein